MPIVNGTGANDFIHRAGDANVPPPTFNEITGVSVLSDTINGNNGDDIIFGDAGADAIFGEDGNDVIEGGAGADTLDGGGGTDTASYATSGLGVTVDLSIGAVPQPAGIIGVNDEAGDTLTSIENLTGSAFGDILTGDAGANRLRGGDGNDFLIGGAGNDTLEGDRGSDTVNANAGNDLIIWRNGDGTDAVNGGADTDTQQLFMSTGATGDIGTLSASGTNAVFARTNLVGFTVTMAAVEEVEFNGLEGNDTLSVGNLAGTDVTRVHFLGGVGNDTLDAAGTATPITAQGGDGNDILTGGDSGDALDGGTGNDTLTGDTGGDTFVFAPGYGADTITDFTSSAGDKIDLSGFTTIQSFPDVQLLATQVGSNTVLNFGNGDTLTLTGVTTSGLTAANFGLPTVEHDFNGNGKSDILWQNTSGVATIWLMNGFSATGGPFYNVDPSWKAIDTGDFNGDGKSDILWQNTNGDATIWQMDGTSATAGPFYDVDPSWNAVGTGDYNGDDKSDILWQNVNGDATIWQMDGTSATAGPFYDVDPSWHPVTG